MSVIRLPSFGFCCFFPWWDAWVVSPYHSCHKVLSVSLIARLHERGKETMTGRERMKDRTQRMIKITAVATCMYTCMSGHGRCLAALTRAYQTRPRVWHALILCSLSLRTNVLRYPLIAQEEIKLLQRIWRVFFPLPVHWWPVVIFADELRLFQPITFQMNSLFQQITLIKLSEYVDFRS